MTAAATSRRITRVESFVHRAPIAVPIRTPFGTIPDRASVFVRIEDSDGAAGWGEIWCNLPTIGAEHRARLFDSFVAPRLLGRDPDADPRGFWHETDRALHLWALQSGEPGAYAAALAGADVALHDLAARRAGVPLWRRLGGTDASPVPAYASGINPGADTVDRIAAYRAAGFTAFKAKLGYGAATDLATLGPAFAALPAGERIMADVNQGWDLAEAVRMAGLIADFPLAWLEEPLAADRPVWEWAQLRAAARAPLAGGENLRGALVFHETLAAGHLAVLQPDLCKWGGLSATLPVARAAVDAGRIYCPHFLGGGVGLLASLHLLAAVRGPGLLELDINPNPLREDLLGGLLRLGAGGAVALPEGPGLGLTPDLAPFAALRTLHTERRAGAGAAAAA